MTIEAYLCTRSPRHLSTARHAQPCPRAGIAGSLRGDSSMAWWHSKICVCHPLRTTVPRRWQSLSHSRYTWDSHVGPGRSSSLWRNLRGTCVVFVVTRPTGKRHSSPVCTQKHSVGKGGLGWCACCRTREVHFRQLNTLKLHWFDRAFFASNGTLTSNCYVVVA